MCMQSWGGKRPRSVTHSGTSFSSTSTRSRGANRAGLSIRSIFARNPNWSRWSLQTNQNPLMLIRLNLYLIPNLQIYKSFPKKYWWLSYIHKCFILTTLITTMTFGFCMKIICVVTFPLIFLIRLGASLIFRYESPFPISAGADKSCFPSPCHLFPCRE